MADDDRRPSNEAILQSLRDGNAHFELVLLSTAPPPTPLPFARIGPPLGCGVSPALKKAERYSVQRITGDGRCMFRALAKGMASNKGSALGSQQEREDADELRMAVKEVICEGNERHNYEEALIAITVEESLERYCQRIKRSDFWGGESELLVLSKLCNQPIIVYIPEHEHTYGGRGNSFIPIAEYGMEFTKPIKDGKPREAVRLLYSGKSHYDLLV